MCFRTIKDLWQKPAQSIIFSPAGLKNIILRNTPWCCSLALIIWAGSCKAKESVSCLLLSVHVEFARGYQIWQVSQVHVEVGTVVWAVASLNGPHEERHWRQRVTIGVRGAVEYEQDNEFSIRYSACSSHSVGFFDTVFVDEVGKQAKQVQL